MRKGKVKLAEMFTPSEMTGGFQQRDSFHEECVAAYLKYMQKFSELDDETCHQIQRECEDIRYKSVDDVYTIDTLRCRLNSIHFMALKDCIDMRIFALIHHGFHEDGRNHPHVTYPEAFVEARNIFKDNNSMKHEGRCTWITELSVKELIGL